MTPRGAIVALSYMAFAVLLVMFNKAALSSYEFPCANVITVMQVGGGCSSGAAKKGFHIKLELKKD
jgi:solute carrier family 35 protein